MKRRRVCTPVDMAGMLDNLITTLERNIGIKAAPEPSPATLAAAEPAAPVRRIMPAVDSSVRDPSREELETEFHKGFSAGSAAARTLISDMRISFGAIRAAVERGDHDGVRSALKLAEIAIGEASV